MKILVLDDETMIANAISRYLTRRGHEVRAFHLGQDLLDHLKTGPAWDILFLDLMLPDINGREILKRLQNSSSTQPGVLKKVVLMSAFWDESLKRQLLETGISDFLRKPFSNLTLLDDVISRIQSSEQSHGTHPIHP